MRGKTFAMFAAPALLGFAILFYLYGGSAVPDGQQPLVSLNDSNLGLLKDSFNTSAGAVRVLVMLSPT
jgi:hypothetical protein